MTPTKNLPEIEVKELPSMRKSYPKNSLIKFRPYTFGEVAKINQSELSLPEYYKQVLEGITCSFDKNALTLFDFQFIGLMRRGFSLTDVQLFTEGTCYLGHHNTDIPFKLSDLEFYDLEVDKLPKSFKYAEKTYSFKPFTIGDYFTLAEVDKLDNRDAVFAQMSTDLDKDNVYNKLSSLPYIEIGKQLNTIDIMLAHGVKPLEVPCTHKNKDGVDCTASVFLNMTEVDSLIVPFRSGQEQHSTDVF
jgi:hypothetical protein